MALKISENGKGCVALFASECSVLPGVLKIEMHTLKSKYRKYVFNRLGNERFKDVVSTLWDNLVRRDHWRRSMSDVCRTAKQRNFQSLESDLS